MVKIYKVEDYDWNNHNSILSRLKRTKSCNVAPEVFSKFEDKLIEDYNSIFTNFYENNIIYDISKYCLATMLPKYNKLEPFLLSLPTKIFIDNFNSKINCIVKNVIPFDKLFKKLYDDLSLDGSDWDELKISSLAFLMNYIIEVGINKIQDYDKYYKKIKSSVFSLMRFLNKNADIKEKLDIFNYELFQNYWNGICFFDALIRLININSNYFINLYYILNSLKEKTNGHTFSASCSEFLKFNKSFFKSCNSNFFNGYLLKPSTSKWFKFQGV